MSHIKEKATMTVDSIVAEVESLLSSSEGQLKVARSRELLRGLLQMNGKFRDFVSLIRPRTQVAFYINAGSVNATRAKLSVRLDGVECGYVVVRSRGDRQFFPTRKHRHFRALWPENAPSSLPWEDQRVRRYVEGVATIVPKMARPEAAVEAALINKMRESGKPSPLRHHQPVLYPTRRGLPFQFPLPVTGSSGRPKLGSGHIDVLARFGNGKGFRVFEVKAPGTGSTRAKAIRQAVIYAATLDYLLSPGIDGDRTFWNSLGKGGSRGKVIEAVAFIEDHPANRCAVDRVIGALNSSNSSKIVTRAMYYEWQESVRGRRLAITHEPAGPEQDRPSS
jgi:hypothetical protein